MSSSLSLTIYRVYIFIKKNLNTYDVIVCNNDIFFCYNIRWKTILMIQIWWFSWITETTWSKMFNVQKQIIQHFFYAMPMSRTKVFFEVCSMFLSLVFFTLRVTVLLTLYVKMPIAGNLFSIKRCYAFWFTKEEALFEIKYNGDQN